MLNVLIAVEDHFNDKISIHNNCLQTFKDTRFYNLDMADHVFEFIRTLQHKNDTIHSMKCYLS